MCDILKTFKNEKTRNTVQIKLSKTVAASHGMNGYKMWTIKNL